VLAEKPRDCHVLLYPAGMVQLNECAAAILALCDAHILPRTREADLAVDVRAFLDVARERGWIIES
jgi:pyrroloquinoline quinone biosynthesis protein D